MGSEIAFTCWEDDVGFKIDNLVKTPLQCGIMVREENRKEDIMGKK